jgi:hypothetical protein
LNLIAVSPVTSTFLGHGTGRKALGIRFEATSYGDVTPSAGRSHSAGIDAPYMTSWHYSGAYARRFQLFADHLGNSRGSAPLGAIGNQNLHWITSFELSLCTS